MSQQYEYVVTANSYQDLESLYHDMETPGGALYIPDREVELVNRRPVSRNTHYMLTDAEAEQLRTDSRVESVTKHYRHDPTMLIMPQYFDPSNFWNVSSTVTDDTRNWGLLRMYEGARNQSWTEASPSRSGTLKVANSGRNVDVVIVDGHLDPAHPEYAVNSDGSGGSRVNQFNWFTIDTGDGNFGGNYSYATTTNSEHGTHVAGIAAGNTAGFARDANIYNIDPYSANPNGAITDTVIDYVRQWHNTKGNSNPTVCQNSWGTIRAFLYSSIQAITIRGTTIVGPTVQQLRDNGIFTDNFALFGGQLASLIPAYYAPVAADVTDAINDGVIVVWAAGNESAITDVLGGLDYNNTLTAGGLVYDIARMMVTDTNALKVGSMDHTVTEPASDFSNRGPNVDVWAPGSRVQSASLSNAEHPDPRNNSYYQRQQTGTSMAAPGVTSLIACLLETYPDMNQSQVRDYIINNAQEFALSGDLSGANNLAARFTVERSLEGPAWPKNNYRPRQQSQGVLYPRPKYNR
jgi:hypothetical protein